jgi:serine protease
MGRLRARLVAPALVACVWACLTTLPVRAQNPSPTNFYVVEGLGLPAVELSAMVGEPHAITTPRTARVAALGTAMAATARVGPSGARYAPGRVLVKFRGVSATLAAQSLRTVSATAALSSRPNYADFDVVTIDMAEDPQQVAATLRERADVEWAQPAYYMHTNLVPNDPDYRRLQWNLPLIDMERAWDIQPDAGSSITVAVIDTGLAYTNATITTNILGFRDRLGVYPPFVNVAIPYAAATQLVTPGRIVAPHDFVHDTSMPFDFDGHGTHVSGTIGQLTNDGNSVAGVAFNVKLMPLKALCAEWDVLFGTPVSRCSTDDNVAQAIRYAADNGAKIINMSIGRDSPSTCATNRNQPDCAPAIEDAMNYAVGKGVFIAIAAGNSFTDGNPTQTPAEIASRIKGAVSVAAVGTFKEHAPYSSSGSWVELAAPGGIGGSDDLGYIWQQTFDFRVTETFDLPPSLYRPPRFDILRSVGYAGTSQATPHVAGLAAMLMQQGVTSPAAIEAVLEKSAIDLGTSGRDDLFGFGLVEARNSLFGQGLAR